MDKKNKDLLVSPSLFTLLIYLLSNKNWKQSDYILLDRIPASVITNLKGLGLKVLCIKSGESFGSSVFSRFLRIVLINLEYLRFLMIYRGDYAYSNIYGNDEMIEAIPFRKFGIKLIEDGSFNLQSKAFFKKRIWIMHKFLLTRILYPDLFSYIPYGFGESVKEIFLTHNTKIDSEINDKVKILSLVKLWEDKSEQEKIEIQNIFGLKNETVNSLNEYPIVLLTQPLRSDEGGFMSEKEKIDIYRDLLKDIPLNKLLIKTHYAEKTNYRKYFKGSLVIDQPIPFQFFDLFNYKPSTVITISSSAALKYKNEDCKIIFTGTEIDRRLVEKYGVVRL